MSENFRQVVDHLAFLDAESRDVGDGRVYHFLKARHQCGSDMVWLVLIREADNKAESLGAYCEECRITVQVPLSHLADLVSDKKLGAVGSSLNMMEIQAALAAKQVEANAALLQKRLKALGLA